MKILTYILISCIVLVFTACSTKTTIPKDIKKDGMQISFADEKWDGEKIPKDEVCSNYNEKAGATPKIEITNLPKGTNLLVFTYSDDTFKYMSMGGHGIISYKVKEGEKTVVVPSFKGETFDLPKGFKSEIAHRGVNRGKKAGAYLAPCSGGKGNIYSVRIEAIHIFEDEKELPELLETKDLVLGRY